MAVEPTACPTLTKGHYAYDFGDTAKLAPMMLMYTLGHTFVPPGIHAGGLRYHGDSPLVSQLYHEGYIEARRLPQRRSSRRPSLFARTEGILPAPESAHAVQAAIEEARRPRKWESRGPSSSASAGTATSTWPPTTPTSRGKLEDYEYPDELIQEALERLAEGRQMKGARAVSEQATVNTRWASLKDVDPEIYRGDPAGAGPAKRQDRADRLGELRQRGGARGARARC